MENFIELTYDHGNYNCVLNVNFIVYFEPYMQEPERTIIYLGNNEKSDFIIVDKPFDRLKALILGHVHD